MNAYFFNPTEEEKNKIRKLHNKEKDNLKYDPNKTQLTVSDIIKDADGVTVNNEGTVTKYKNFDINKK